jgi:glycosyltransferase involved in cell wall biosynthesis
MYDAVNRGMARATGEYCAFLNCDEQYLPGTLKAVANAFDENPWADAIAGDFLVLDADSRLLSFRKVTPLRRAMIESDHLYAYTCAIFFRRRLLDEGIRYNSNLKDVADLEWVCEVLRRGHRFALLHQYLSTFVFTGENRSVQGLAKSELAAVNARVSPAVRFAKPLLRAYRHVEKAIVGGYHSGPISYEVYASDDATKRTLLTCKKPSQRYPTA